jgi:hypothetical protein
VIQGDSEASHRPKERSSRAENEGDEMGRDLEDFLRSAEEGGSDLWHKLRAQAAAGTQDAYQRGRQVYDEAVRTGRDVVARTPSEVARVGRAANATVRGAANSASLGLADPLEAGTEALVGMGGSGNFQQRYQNQLALQHQDDAEAQREFPELYKWSGRAGALGGMIASGEIRVPGVIAKAVPAVGRAVKAVQSTRRIGFVPGGFGTMGAVGGATIGATGQVVGDAARGKASSPMDVLDAAAGGAVSGYEATRGRPVFGAAVGSGVTTGLQDANRGVWSLDDVLQSAQTGAYAGQAFNGLGRFGSNALPNQAKKVLGEGLTFAKSWARGEPIPISEPAYSPEVVANLPTAEEGLAGPQRNIGLSRRYTKADWISMPGNAYEAKFGAFAGPTSAQRRAAVELAGRYFYDHWLPSDVGVVAAGWLAPPIASNFGAFGED